MARVVKEQEYAERRNQILDVAQKLVYTQGYEQMSIQDILDGLKMSKGAFYHYFGSKQALLEALIGRMLDEAECIVNPILQDAGLSAIVKLQRFFGTVANWKVARKDYLLAIMRVLYSDDNAIFRQKLVVTGITRFTVHLNLIIRQGIEEGQLKTNYPDQAGEIAWWLAQSLGDTLARWLLTRVPGADDLPRMNNVVAAYTDALESILGTPHGSINLLGSVSLQDWVSDA